MLKIPYIDSLLNKNEKKLLKNVLVQGPAHLKKPFGLQVGWYSHILFQNTTIKVANNFALLPYH